MSDVEAATNPMLSSAMPNLLLPAITVKMSSQSPLEENAKSQKEVLSKSSIDLSMFYITYFSLPSFIDLLFDLKDIKIYRK